IGETLRAMLPPEIELRHEREYALTEAGRAYLNDLASADELTDAEKSECGLLRALADPISRRKRIDEPTAERLVRLGYLSARHVLRDRKTRMQKIIAWNAAAQNEPASNRTPAESRIHEILAATRGPLPLPLLLEKAGVTRAVVARLEKKGLLDTWEEPLTSAEDPWDAEFTPPSNVLNAEQNEALGEIWRWLLDGKFTAGLLHGVTGSGKTEVYLGAIAAALSRGKTAIVLVPEIALTLWIGRLVRARFGEGVAVLHSGLADIERAREWWRVRRGEARVVVGTRSAVFAPLENLGLIIVDEEQESAYKQEEIPRYHGRDTAVYRARLENAVALLGSATPSLETYHNARAEKYRLLRLTSRVENRPLADVRVIDLREEFRAHRRAAPISEPLRQAIAMRLAEKTQTMILINRRGYSWSLLCRGCGAFVQCRNCSIALTYHKSRQRLECHYCGFAARPPKQCPKCSAEFMYFVGDGAERVEEYLREIFPAARIARLDRDTVRTRREYQKILGAFAKCQLDILVGTQMVAKGHDFQRVTLVGVVAADLALGRPDFRAAERTFHLLAQVAGRAGRGELSGEVLVETYYPEHYAIGLAARQDYLSFFEKEVHFRRVLHYPPFTALASVLVRDRKIENAIQWSRALAAYFAPFENRGIKVLGPASAPLARLRRDYRFQIILKSPRRSALGHAVDGCLDFCAKHEIPPTAVIVDVDPANLS
ncbi:MAG: primosomal protein N', partial [Acidobacteriota bacterium]|nr:primosomal protein N' [Acidobacteriota bacterium]